MRRFAMAAWLLFGAASLPLAVAPNGAVAQDAESMGGSNLDFEGNGPDYWRERVLEVRARLTAARKRENAARTAYKNMRQRRHPRGEAAAEIEAEFEAATREREQAEAALEALDEEARQAGAPPGWLRVED
ncbi:MAG: hypothetical protein JSU66_12550 [Deltaproteobacteria bacterium]|nr:MAG: hypothetical protein JSU66_12550 [Deltaproteobacteria bacterium]